MKRKHRHCGSRDVRRAFGHPTTNYHPPFYCLCDDDYFDVETLCQCLAIFWWWIFTRCQVEDQRSTKIQNKKVSCVTLHGVTAHTFRQTHTCKAPPRFSSKLFQGSPAIISWLKKRESPFWIQSPPSEPPNRWRHQSRQIGIFFVLTGRRPRRPTT